MDEVDQCEEGSAHGRVSKGMVYTCIDALLQGYCPKLNFISTVFDYYTVLSWLC